VTHGVPPTHRSSQVALYRDRIGALDPTQQWDPKALRATWGSSQLEKGGRS
jgi:malonate decarboxylase beta subunit